MTETSMPRVVTTIADFRTAITESLAAAQEELDRAARQEAEQNGHRSSVQERIPGLRAHHGRPARRPRNPVASRH